MDQITVPYLVGIVADVLPGIANDKQKTSDVLKASAFAIDNCVRHNSDFVGVNDWATLDQLLSGEMVVRHKDRTSDAQPADTEDARRAREQLSADGQSIDASAPSYHPAVDTVPDFVDKPGDEQSTTLDGTQIEPSGTARLGSPDGGPEVAVAGVDAPYTTHLDAPFEAASPQGEGKIDPVDVNRPDATAAATPTENPPVSPLPGPVVDLPPKVVAPPPAVE